MSSPSPFAALPKPKLSREDVVRYLIALRGDGYEVYQHPDHGHILVLVLDELHRIDFVLNEHTQTCQIQAKRYGNSQNYHDVETLQQLEQAVASLARSVAGIQWPCCPTRARLSAATPCTNFRAINQLIGSANIEAVFDPYLENCSLATLIDILSFGSGGGAGGVATGVRLLGSTHKTKGPVPQFTKIGVDSWLKQLGIQGEARVMAPNDQHRRFMLLSGGQSLILGHSLNAIHKNEATHVEPDAADRLFFDGVWGTATPLT
jgi:hypothetical protein